MSSIDQILGQYRSGSQDSLIPILQDIQSAEGYISEQSVVRVGAFLGISTTKIYGLATFYDQFRFTPAGRVHLKVCNGTTCFINGSEKIVKSLRETLGVDPGQTTRDGRFSYELTSCMGGCNEGPVACHSGRYITRMRPEDIPELVNNLKPIADSK